MASASHLERAGHVRVHRADERVGARGKRRDVVGLRGDAVEDLALEDGLAVGVLDLDVVRDARVLVVERDLEGLVRRGAELRLVERDVEGRELEDRAGRGLRRAGGARGAGAPTRRGGRGAGRRGRRERARTSSPGTASRPAPAGSWARPSPRRSSPRRSPGRRRARTGSDPSPGTSRPCWARMNAIEVLDLLVVERPGRVPGVRPDRHEALRVAAHVPAADRQDGAQVLAG